MHGKILVGVDDRERSRDALALGRLIAGKTGATLIAVQAYSAAGDFPIPADPTWDDAMYQVALKVVADVIAGGPDGERAEAVHSSSPARGLHDLAEREQADLIVVGSSERGALGRLTAGSTAHSLLSGAPCAVAVAPAGYAERPEQRLETIGVAFDARPESDLALESAIDLARSAGARVHLVTLAYPPDRPFLGEGPAPVDVPAMLESITEKMQAVQDAAVARIPDDVEHSGQVFADPQVALVHVEGVDVMVMGSRNYGPVRRVLLGSLARQVMGSAPWPVIVVPRGAGGS